MDEESDQQFDLEKKILVFGGEDYSFIFFSKNYVCFYCSNGENQRGEMRRGKCYAKLTKKNKISSKKSVITRCFSKEFYENLETIEKKKKLSLYLCDSCYYKLRKKN